jgi:hypothetical protein
MSKVNERIRTQHTLHDSENQLRCGAISHKCITLKVGIPYEFMTVYMYEPVVKDLIQQLEDALDDMKER